jgi:hypothetical protein
VLPEIRTRDKSLLKFDWLLPNYEKYALPAQVLLICASGNENSKIVTSPSTSPYLKINVIEEKSLKDDFNL